MACCYRKLVFLWPTCLIILSYQSCIMSRPSPWSFPSVSQLLVNSPLPHQQSSLLLTGVFDLTQSCCSGCPGSDPCLVHERLWSCISSFGDEITGIKSVVPQRVLSCVVLNSGTRQWLPALPFAEVLFPQLSWGDCFSLWNRQCICIWFGFQFELDLAFSLLSTFQGFWPAVGIAVFGSGFCYQLFPHALQDLASHSIAGKPRSALCSPFTIYLFCEQSLTRCTVGMLVVGSQSVYRHVQQSL